MTADELDAIEARADAATYGPWRSTTLDVEEGYALGAGIYRGTIPLLLTTSGVAVADAEFIAHARTDVPALVAALRAVLDLHQPDPANPPDPGEWLMCQGCEQYYPCDTVRAVESVVTP